MIFLVVFFYLLGIAGCFVNFLPGVTMVFAGIFLYGFFEGFHHITRVYILVLLIITTVIVLVDTFTLKRNIFTDRVKRGVIRAVVSSGIFISFLLML